jgi:hypothetical protein
VSAVDDAQNTQPYAQASPVVAAVSDPVVIDSIPNNGSVLMDKNIAIDPVIGNNNTQNWAPIVTPTTKVNTPILTAKTVAPIAAPQYSGSSTGVVMKKVSQQ